MDAPAFRISPERAIIGTCPQQVSHTLYRPRIYKEFHEARVAGGGRR